MKKQIQQVFLTMLFIILFGKMYVCVANERLSAQELSILSTPSDFSATDCSSNDSVKIRLTFSQVSEAGLYEIFRSSSDIIEYSSSIGTTNDLFFDDTSCIYEKVYYYWVRAINEELNAISKFSESVIGCPRMPPVTDVIASDGTDCESVLIRFLPIPDSDYHNISYRLYSTTPGKRDRVDDTFVSLISDNAIAGKIVYYRIQAFNEYGFSISAPDPGWKKMCAVTNLKTLDIESPGAVSLSWGQVNDASKYIILRGVSNIEDASPIGSTNGLTFIDSSADKSYRYWVKAINEYTESISTESVIGSPQFCDFSIDPSNIQFNEDGGEFSVNVETNFNVCEWRASTEFNWISLKNYFGIGNGQFIVMIDPTQSDRTGFIDIDRESSAFKPKELRVDQYLTYTLHINGNDQGKVKINNTIFPFPYENTFRSNDEVRIQAVPLESNDPCFFHSFHSWSGLDNQLSDINLLMDQNYILTANFIEMVTLNLMIEDAGRVNVNGRHISMDSTFEFHANDQITMEAIPENGSEFIGWKLNEQPPLIQSAMIELTLTQCYSAKAIFDSGWNLHIKSQRDDKFTYVIIGINNSEVSWFLPTSFIDDKPRIHINRFYAEDYSTCLFADVHKKINDPYYENYYWGLSINPHGYTSPPFPLTSTVSWDSGQIDTNYSCQVLEGYDGQGDVIVSDMIKTDHFSVTGTRNFQYFTVRCRKIPERPVLIVEGQENEGTSAVSVVLDTGSDAQHLFAPPVAPEFSCDLYIVPVPDWNNPTPVWDVREKANIYEQGHDVYNWLIAVNPHGNTGSPIDRTSLLRWDLTNFNEGNVGFWKLIEGDTLSGKIVVQDMKQTREIQVKGGNEFFYYIVHWSRFWELDLVKGWNMISLSVTLDDMSVYSLFPNAEIVYSFRNGQYQIADQIVPGTGYWVKVPENKSYRFYGTPIYKYTKDLNAGWHLVGAVWDSVVPTTDVDNAISSIFGYSENRYENESSFIKGCAYWVRLNEPATLFAKKK